MRTKHAIYNIITSLLLKIIVLSNGFIVQKIIINNFGSDANGLVSSITRFLAYISLMELGIGSVIKAALYKPIARKNTKEILKILKTSDIFFKKIATIFLFYTAAIATIYPMIVKNTFNFIYVFSLTIIIAISLFSEYYFGITYKLYMQAKQKGYIISIIQMIAYLISLIATIILSKIRIKLHLIKFLYTITMLLAIIIQNSIIKKKNNINLKKINKGKKINQKWDAVAQHIAWVIHSNTDIVLLTLFTNLKEVSVYSVYYLVIGGIKSTIQAITSSLDSGFGDMLAKKEYSKLKKVFNTYEIIYSIICTIIFTCTIAMIVPFVSIYTKGIQDVNYIRYSFGILIVISEYIWAIRLPYNSLVITSGNFKETKKGAWIESFINILISIILVRKYGIIGVTIGTTAAMIFRTIELILFANKKILRRKTIDSFKKIILMTFGTTISMIIISKVHFLKTESYSIWFINALITFIITTIIVTSIYSIIYIKDIKKMIKNKGDLI